MKTAIIGTGKLGEAIARKLVKTGYTVMLTNSRGAASLKDKAREIGDLAIPADLKEIIDADIIFLTVPWSKISTVAKALPDLSGKVMVDATNQFLDDMSLDDLKGKSSSRIVQEYFPGVKLVKALNHYFEKWVNADPGVGDGKRLAFVSGDDAEAKSIVLGLLSGFGFQSVDMGDLDNGSLQQQAGGPLAGLNLVSYPA